MQIESETFFQLFPSFICTSFGLTRALLNKYFVFKFRLLSTVCDRESEKVRDVSCCVPPSVPLSCLTELNPHILATWWGDFSSTFQGTLLSSNEFWKGNEVRMLPVSYQSTKKFQSSHVNLNARLPHKIAVFEDEVTKSSTLIGLELFASILYATFN